jgi:hypothetical protein
VRITTSSRSIFIKSTWSTFNVGEDLRKSNEHSKQNCFLHQKLVEKRKQGKKNTEKAREEDSRSEEDDDEFEVDIHWVNLQRW